jgi:hypothetical protein
VIRRGARAYRERIALFAQSGAMAALLVAANRLVAFAVAGDSAPPALPSAHPAPKSVYPAYGQPGVFAKSGRLPAVEVVGCNLAQEGRTLAGAPPALLVGVPLDITLQLKPVGITPEGTELRIIIRGPGYGPAPSFLKTYPIERGQTAFGCVAPWDCSLDLPRRVFVGNGILTIAQIAPGEPAKNWAVLYAAPVRVPAVTWAAGFGNELFERIYGAGQVRLGQSFRLAPNTSVVLQVPVRLETPPRSLGVVSAYRYDAAAPQGTRICRVDLIDAAGETRETTYIQCGVSTAYDLHGAVPPEQRAAQAIETAFTEPAQDRAEGAAKSHYAGRIPLSEGLRPATLLFTYVHDSGALDVDDVVLVRGAPDETPR